MDSRRSRSPRASRASTIVVSVEGQPRQLEFEQLEELGIRIDAVAHDVHVTNLRHVTLFDLDADGDAVPRQFGDR